MGDAKLDAGSFFPSREFPGVLKQIHQDDAQQRGISGHGYLGGNHELDAALGVARFQQSEEHTSELQSHLNLVCRLLLEKKKKKKIHEQSITDTCLTERIM